jgi:nuclear transport factor 2 (NTF2) superfamily protein
MRISTKSSAFFNEDIDDENTSIYPDDKAGFFGINSKYKWFFHATKTGEEYDYNSIEPKGIWKSQEQRIRCYDCFYSDGIFHVTISFDNGEIWLQHYNVENGIFTEEKLMSLKKDAIIQMKVVKFNDTSFTILAKFQNSRWHYIDVKL